MGKKLLVSTPIIFTPKEILQEEFQGQKILRVRGKCQEMDGVNANGRIYPRELWEKLLESKEVKKRLKERSLLGELDHPTDRVYTELKNVSHVVTKLWEQDNALWFEAEVIKTVPAGKILSELFANGVKVGVSSRGVGSVNNRNGYEEVNPDEYELIAFDFVSNPSVSGAYPVLAENKQLKEDIMNKNNLQAFKEAERLAHNILRLKKVPASVRELLSTQILELEDTLGSLSEGTSSLKYPIKKLIEQLERKRNRLLLEQEGENEEELEEQDEEKEEELAEQNKEEEEKATEEELEEQDEEEEEEEEEKELSEMTRPELIKLVKLQDRIIKEADKMLNENNLEGGDSKKYLKRVINELVNRIGRVIKEGKVKLSDFLVEQSDLEDDEEIEEQGDTLKLLPLKKFEQDEEEELEEADELNLKPLKNIEFEQKEEEEEELAEQDEEEEEELAEQDEEEEEELEEQDEEEEENKELVEGYYYDNASNSEAKLSLNIARTLGI